MRRILALLFTLAGFAVAPSLAPRRPVLPQIDEPHPYYYRELYLPQLTSGPSSLSWSPDSQELIYSMAGSLWRQKLDSKEAQQLTDGPGYDYQPDWSPDGKFVVYVSYQNDAMELWLLDLASGKSSQLTTGGAVNVEPRWAPNGKKLLWVSTQYNKHFHIFAGDVRNGTLENAVRLTGENKSSLPRYYYSAYDMEINPVWTRDGQEILFVSNRGHIHGTGGFWRMKAEPGAEAREIHYEETNWKARPEFSPDGSRIVYSSYLGSQWHNLWLMPANGGDAFPISYGNWDKTNARWSPDGQKIGYISNENGSARMEIFHPIESSYLELQPETKVYLKSRATLEVSIEAGNKNSTAARISIEDGEGKSYAPDGTWILADDGFDRAERRHELHYFQASSPFQVVLPEGDVTVRVSKGFRMRPVSERIHVRRGQLNKLEVKLNSIDGIPEAGGHWLSADLHVHMNYGGVYRNEPTHLMQQADAEGLEVVHELIVNKEQRFPDVEFLNSQPDEAALRELRGYWHFEPGQEFHTSYWGHRGILGLKSLLLPAYAGYPNTAAASLYPMNADVYDAANRVGALVGAVHPFDAVPDPFANPPQRITDELPVDAALGKLDYMEIVGFSDHKATAEVWYKLLNLGFRLPAGAGTDATMNYAAPIRGTAGQDRVYIWMPDWPSPSVSWMEQIKRGRTFATNGPLIEFMLGGEMVGSELKFDAPQAAIPFTARLRSIVPVDHLELVCNGKVVQDLKLAGQRDSADLSGAIPLKQSGWCVLRAWSDLPHYPVMDNYAYATTSPIYVTVAGKRPYSGLDAQYFLSWIDRTIEVTSNYPDWNSPQEKEHVLQTLRNGRAVIANLH